MELRLNATISADHRLTIEVPPEIPEGPVEVVINVPEVTDFTKRNRELFVWLDTLHADPNRPTRTKEEIDAALAVERDSWD